MRSSTRGRSGAKLATLIVLIGAMLATMTSPVAAGGGERPGPVIVEGGVGFYYGDFGSPVAINMVVGGAAEDFCEADPESPFGAEPGTATLRIREKADGTTVIRMKTWEQPVYLYKDAEGQAPIWINQVCDAYFGDGTVPEPFAVGTATVRSVVKIMPDGTVDVFNVSRGFVYDADGAKYKVRGSADFIVKDGAPVGDPTEFVSFKLRKVRGY